MESTTDVLNLPEQIIPVGLVAIGIKNKEPTIIDRYNEDKIHYDRW